MTMQTTRLAFAEFEDLLAQAMSYAASGGKVKSRMADGATYSEAFVAALEGSGYKIVAIDPKEAEAEAALAQT